MNQPLIARGKIKLKDYDPAFRDGFKKDEVREKTLEMCQQIGELQELLYANSTHSLVILFQGMDASGKDGAVKQVLQYVNPAGVETANFKAPSAEELAHDFLWRIHKAAPRYGNIGIFNRSHYEDVLVVRIFNLQLEKVWRKRYAQINAFEDYLHENHVILCKFFLHISKNEQAARLKKRLEDPAKNWKFDVQDLKMRQHWADFEDAFEDMLSRCSTKVAPWHIVPADNKWYRDYAVAGVVLKALKNLKMSWPKPKEDFSQVQIS